MPQGPQSLKVATNAKGKTFVDGRVNLTGKEVNDIQVQLRLSDHQLAELLGLSPLSGPARLRRWKDGIEEPTGASVKALLLWSKLDRIFKLVRRANAKIDSGEWDVGHEMLRQADDKIAEAVPDFMR